MLVEHAALEVGLDARKSLRAIGVINGGPSPRNGRTMRAPLSRTWMRWLLRMSGLGRASG